MPLEQSNLISEYSIGNAHRLNFTDDFVFFKNSSTEKITNDDVSRDQSESKSPDSKIVHKTSDKIYVSNKRTENCSTNILCDRSKITGNEMIEQQKVQSNMRSKPQNGNFVRLMVHALERNGNFDSSISKNWTNRMCRRKNSSCRPSCKFTKEGDLECKCRELEDEEVHWTDLNRFELPRSSSVVSIINYSRKSPDISPICTAVFKKKESKENNSNCTKDQVKNSEKEASSQKTIKLLKFDSGYLDESQSENALDMSEKRPTYSPEIDAFIKSGPSFMKAFFI